MSDRLHCNVTQHCSLCPPADGSDRNWQRCYVGTFRGALEPSIAVCPVHDVAGPVDLLPESLQTALDRRHA